MAAMSGLAPRIAITRYRLLGENVKADLRPDVLQPLHQEMAGAGPGFHGSEGVLYELAAGAHAVGCEIEPSLKGSITASCSQRVTRRIGLGVHRLLILQARRLAR